MPAPFSRVLHGLTAAYGLYAIVRPDHLARALGETPSTARRRLAYTYGARDLPVSALGVLGDADRLRAASLLRIAGDVTDAAILGATTTGQARTKAASVALGWGAVNVLAYLLEQRRS